MRMAAIRSILFAFMMMAMGSVASAQFGVSITIAPPALPVYEQPVCPGDGFIWTPGYWAWSDGGYYWVPGTWILAPQPNYLWTPPYWGWGNGVYLFHEGYWGPHVGFYGGVSYGFGYFGNGYEGGRWDGGHFYYNRSVNNVNVTVVKNVYNTTIINRNESRVSYNGGNGGINARASSEEQRYDNERHVGPVAAQTQHIDAARGNPQFRASENRGKPPVAATSRAGEFNHEAVPAKEAGGEYHGGEEHGNNVAANNAKPMHAKELSQPTRNTIAPTGNAKNDTKYQQQQQKLTQKQDQERTKLQQNQEKEDQRMTQQKYAAPKQQQTEQRHAQQAQQMQQKHQTEQTHFESKAAPAQHPSGGGGEHHK